MNPQHVEIDKKCATAPKDAELPKIAARDQIATSRPIRRPTRWRRTERRFFFRRGFPDGRRCLPSPWRRLTTYESCLRKGENESTGGDTYARS